MQAVENLGQRQRAHACSRQFDRERHAVEPLADLGHRPFVLIGGAELGPHPTCALFEQLERLRRPATATALARSLHRSIRSVLCSSSGCVNPGQAVEKRDNEIGARIEQMLAVVQHHQQLTITDEPDHGVDPRCGPVDLEVRARGPPRRVRAPASVIGARSTYRTSSPNSRATSIASRVLPEPPAPVRVTRRLSASSPRTSAICAFTPDETRQLRWKTLGGFRFRSTQRRKVIADVRMAQLDNAFRPRKVAQRMRSVVVQPGILGQMVDHHRLGRARQQRLAAMTQIAKPAPCG